MKIATYNELKHEPAKLIQLIRDGEEVRAWVASRMDTDGHGRTFGIGYGTFEEARDAAIKEYIQDQWVEGIAPYTLVDQDGKIRAGKRHDEEAVDIKQLARECREARYAGVIEDREELNEAIREEHSLHFGPISNLGRLREQAAEMSKREDGWYAWDGAIDLLVEDGIIRRCTHVEIPASSRTVYIYDRYGDIVDYDITIDDLINGSYSFN